MIPDAVETLERVRSELVSMYCGLERGPREARVCKLHVDALVRVWLNGQKERAQERENAKACDERTVMAALAHPAEGHRSIGPAVAGEGSG